jgi:putative FmdB family regulatory protein
MPIYEYICTKCKTEFDLMRPFSEADKPAVCPKCNTEAQKLVSGFASLVGSHMQTPTKPLRKRIAKNQTRRSKV